MICTLNFMVPRNMCREKKMCNICVVQNSVFILSEHLRSNPFVFNLSCYILTGNLPVVLQDMN